LTYIHPKDRTLEHSATSGAGPFALSGAIDTSFNAFSASMAVGDTTIGTIVEPGVAFWSGVLTYSAANQVTATGTAFDSKGTFGAGTKEIFMGGPASRTPLRDSNNAFDGLQVFNNTTEATGLGTVASALFAGGVEFAKKIFVGGIATFASPLVSNDATEATSATAASAAFAGGVGVAKKLFVTGASAFASSVLIAGALTYGGVALANSVTGSGSMVLSNSPTFTGTLFAGSISAIGGTDHVFGPGGTGIRGLVAIDGGTGSSGGAIIKMRVAGVDKVAVGMYSALVGGALNTDLVFWNSTAGTMAQFATATGALSLNSTTASTSSTTGALTVGGGTGISGALYVGSISQFGTAGVFAGSQVSVDNATAGRTALSVVGVAAKFIVDYQGFGNSYSDATNSYFRTFAGAIYATINSTSSSFLGNSNSFGSGGTSSAVSNMTINGGSATGGGAYVNLAKNTSSTWVIGHYSAILGSGTYSDLALYNATDGKTSLKVSSADSSIALTSTVASTSSTTGALTVAGGLGVVGSLYAQFVSSSSSFNSTQVLGQPNFQNSVAIYTLANGANVQISANGYQILFVSEQAIYGWSGLYLCSNGITTLIGATGNFVAGTSPAAGYVSVGWNGSAFSLYNNSGNSGAAFKVTMIRNN
jgi:hypothetical protein